jgi:hypothetical protein
MHGGNCRNSTIIVAIHGGIITQCNTHCEIHGVLHADRLSDSDAVQCRVRICAMAVFKFQLGINFDLV